MNPKNIVEIKKQCLICESKANNCGIYILNNFICEKCISNINNSDVNDKEYEIFKNKLKKILINYL